MPNARSTTSQRRFQVETFGAFTPDQPALESQGLTYLRNAVPLSTGRYGPAQDLVPDSAAAITDVASGFDRVSGSIGSYRNLVTNANTHFAGAYNATTATMKFMAYSERDRTWTDVTRASADYRSDQRSHARFAAFGEDIFGVMGRREPLQVLKVDQDSAFDDVPGAPPAQDIAVVRNFLVVTNIRLPGVSVPDAVSWSAITDPRLWPAPGSPAALEVVSGFAQLPGGGRLQRIVPGIGGNDAVIIAENRIFSMNFTGNIPIPWQFDVVDYDQGTTVPGSVASNNELVFFLGRSGFAVFDGNRSQNIGAGKFDKAFLDDPTYSVRTVASFGFQQALAAAVDSSRQTYVLSYRRRQDAITSNLVTLGGDQLQTLAGDDLTVNTESSNNNALAFYNYLGGHWGHADIGVDAIGLVDSGRGFVDTPLLVGIAPDTKRSAFTGSNLAAVFETPERFAANGNRDQLIKVLPGTDATEVEVSFKQRDRLSDPLIQSPPRTMENDGRIPAGRDGLSSRYWRLVMDIPEGADWSYAIGAEVEVQDWGQGAFS
jgi:hypothetical protein